MSIIRIIGGKELYGEVDNQISKNATLPILASTLMIDGTTTLVQCPHITDVANMIKILNKYGVEARDDNGRLMLDSRSARYHNISDSLNRTMRSSLFMIGPSLARFKQASITMPGGCRIGSRPIDIHLSALKKLGVKISSIGDRIFFNSSNAHSGRVRFKLPSVGATENIVMFACKLKGKTTIINPAREPEVVDLCNYLNTAGAKIVGAGTNKITIYGVEHFNNTIYMPSYDRIVAGTILLAVAGCGGDVTIHNGCYNELTSLIDILIKLGCEIRVDGDSINIRMEKELTGGLNISTGYYPDFPTDLQPMMMCLLSQCQGVSALTEKVFDNRLGMAKILQRMGANVKQLTTNSIEIYGHSRLVGRSVVARDLRGGAGLVLAGLFSDGETSIRSIKHIERGYEDIVDLFRRLGADIIKI